MTVVLAAAESCAAVLALCGIAVAIGGWSSGCDSTVANGPTTDTQAQTSATSTSAHSHAYNFPNHDNAQIRIENKANHRHRHTRRAGVPASDVPNHRLTPGAAFHGTRAAICTPGYSARVRDVPEDEATAVYQRYHTAHRPYAHEVDHLVSLEIGGSNAITNLWPEPYAGRWGARTKDVLENKLHDLVCSGQLKLKKAQHQEAANWVGAYRRYVSQATPTAPANGGRPNKPKHRSPTGKPPSGGYWASTYGSADTIYCADDPEWRSLSTTYLEHFQNLHKAQKALPGYHLHRPC